MIVGEDLFGNVNRMVEYFTNKYEEGSIPYQVSGRPSSVDYTNMTLIVGRHSYYVGASKSKLQVYELGFKTFPNQMIDLESISKLEYNESYILIEYGEHTLYLDLSDGKESCLK